MTRLRRWLPTLLCLACAVAAVAPALAAAGNYADRYDWRYFESMGEASRRSVLWWHQAPLWNPYSCGGEVALANPQSLDAAPTFALVLLFGVAVGYKLALVLYYFCAMDGARRLGRRLGLSEAAALLAGAGFGLSGYLALHWAEGHFTFLGVALFPYLLLCYHRALDETEWLVPTGLVAAWIALDGGTFTPPMAAELLLVWGTAAAIARRSWRPYWLLAAAGAVALAVGAVRMFPVLEFVHDHPRPPFMRASDASAPWHLVADLVSWRWFGPLDGRKYWSHEYTARMPWVLAPLWAAGIAAAFLRAVPAEKRATAKRLLVVAAWGALLASGNFAPIAPWSLLQRLPVLRDLRVPSRHEILIVLPLALLAGWTWDRVAERFAARYPSLRGKLPWIAAALVLAACVDGAVYSAIQYQGVFTAPLRVPDGPVPFYHVPSDAAGMRGVLFAGHGALGCDEEAPLQRAEGLDPGDVPQARLLDPAAGEIVESKWTPNRREITVELRRPTVLFVNSNWNEHWRTDLGRITRVAGRLSVDDLPLGRHTVTLRYAPRSFTVGAIVTALSLPLALAAFALARRRRRSRG